MATECDEAEEARIRVTLGTGWTHTTGRPRYAVSKHKLYHESIVHLRLADCLLKLGRIIFF